jgi:hypothetical protein
MHPRHPRHPRAAALVLPVVVVSAASAMSCGRATRPDDVAARDTALHRDAALAPVALAAPEPPDAGGLRCTADPTFPSVLAVPEASAAAEVTLLPGVRELLVISDSENHGKALAYAIPSGPARPLTLPLDPKVSDDTEGMAWYRGHVYVLASAGYVERFTADGKGGLTRDGAAYGLGGAPYTSGSKWLMGTPPDFEGLCLRSPKARPGRCAGYAASRAYGWLVCLQWTRSGERLRVDPDHPRLALDLKKHTLSDCAFGDEDGPAKDVLLVATNIFGGSTVYRVDELTGALAPLDADGTPNDEAITVDHEGRLYRIMDGNSATSPSQRSTCTGW